jgi:hypothetical protein
MTAIGTKRTIQPRPRLFAIGAGHWSTLPPNDPVMGHEAKLARFQSPHRSIEFTWPGQQRERENSYPRK